MIIDTKLFLKVCVRFKVKKELPNINGFRIANIDWKKYRSDFSQGKFNSLNHRISFEDILKKYLSKNSINADWEAIEASGDEELINSISMGCPFSISEKQALLEAESLDKRMQVLISLMEMSMNENKSLSTSSLS